MIKRCRGFTLIELSIVLVIIGLIVGGVLVGQNLIRAAELRSIITDIEKFNTATNTFVGKYGCLPGDCANATEFFSADAQCANNAALTTGTCNGDGDGILSENGSTINNFYHQEVMVYWQQLTLAGLIPGEYTGLSTSGNDGAVIGVNVPTSRISGACYSVMYEYASNSLNFNTSGAMYANLNAHMFLLGAPVIPGDGDWPCGYGGGPLTPADAMNIDQKIDDGLPYSGRVSIASYQYTNGVYGPSPCMTTSAPYTYTASTYTSPVCPLFIEAQF